MAEQDDPQAPTCPHPSFRADVSVNRIEDVGRFSADIRITCEGCKEPFRFLGVDPGVSFRVPRVSIDGLQLRAPIEPEGKPALFSRATFEMPEKQS